MSTEVEKPVTLPQSPVDVHVTSSANVTIDTTTALPEEPKPSSGTSSTPETPQSDEKPASSSSDVAKEEKQTSPQSSPRKKKSKKSPRSSKGAADQVVKDKEESKEPTTEVLAKEKTKDKDSKEEKSKDKPSKEEKEKAKQEADPPLMPGEIQIAIANKPIVRFIPNKQGELEGKHPGIFHSSWEKDYLVLSSDSLYCFKDKELKSLEWDAKCAECAVAVVKHETRSSCFAITAGQPPNQKVYVFDGTTDTDRDAWIDALVGFGMMREEKDVAVPHSSWYKFTHDISELLKHPKITGTRRGSTSAGTSPRSPKEGEATEKVEAAQTDAPASAAATPTPTTTNTTASTSASETVEPVSAVDSTAATSTTATSHVTTPREDESKPAATGNTTEINQPEPQVAAPAASSPSTDSPKPTAEESKDVEVKPGEAAEQQSRPEEPKELINSPSENRREALMQSIEVTNATASTM